MGRRKNCCMGRSRHEEITWRHRRVLFVGLAGHGGIRPRLRGRSLFSGHAPDGRPLRRRRDVAADPNDQSQRPDGSREYDLDFDLAKRITPDLGLTFGDGWKWIHMPGQATLYGLDTLQTGLQYQLFIDPASETMALAGLNITWAHTGRVNAVGADDFTTVSPTFDFGKGFGDLPDSMKWLKPIAVTGNLSIDFPTKTESAGNNANPNNFNYGFAFEYSLEYLQHHVQDVGLSAPFDQSFRSSKSLSRRRSIAARQLHHRHGAAGRDLGGSIFPNRRRDDLPSDQTFGTRGRRPRSVPSLPRRPVSEQYRKTDRELVDRARFSTACVAAGRGPSVHSR